MVAGMCEKTSGSAGEHSAARRACHCQALCQNDEDIEHIMLILILQSRMGLERVEDEGEDHGVRKGEGAMAVGRRRKVAVFPHLATFQTSTHISSTCNITALP